MSAVLLVAFAISLGLGIGLSFLLYKKDREHKESKFFWSSKHLAEFGLEIMIVLVGFGLTLAFTNAYERQLEKENAAHMIQQVVEFTDWQIKSERSYLNSYNKGDLTVADLRVSNGINLNYYNSILSSDIILQNVNMNTYGNIMRYLLWIEQRDELAKNAKDEHVYTYMEQRYRELKALREYLLVCQEELQGVITAEEAKERCKEINHKPTIAPTETTVPASS